MIFNGAVGTIFRWTIEDSNGPIDVSLSDVKQVKFLRPDGTTVLKTLAFSTSDEDSGTGSDGRVEYITVEEVVGPPLVEILINQPGLYEWQIYIQIDNWHDHTQKGSFIVGTPIEIIEEEC